MVMSLSFIIYEVMISQTVFGILRLMHISSVSSHFFHVKANEERLSYVYPCVSLINQVFVICSFTILHRVRQLCSTWVVLDLRYTCEWIISSLSRLVHWKGRFQSLYILFLMNTKLYLPNFADVSCIIVKIRKFQVWSLMHILIMNL